MSRGVVVLGSTGSIGRQALDVLRSHPDDYRLVAIAAGRNVEALVAQAEEFGLGADAAQGRAVRGHARARQ